MNFFVPMRRPAAFSYRSFLENKVAMSRPAGFAVRLEDIHPILKDHQRAIVQWAVAGGCRAVFAAFGLGKSLIQLEWQRLIRRNAGGAGLIVCPLGVRQEFRRDAGMLGIETRFIRTNDEFDPDFEGIYLTNYESVRDGKLDPNLFTAVSLDEASILRSYGSKTYQTFLELFGRTRFKLVATATPSPNRFKELIHYCGFLGVMDTGQALTRFFQRDSAKANNLTLYPHKEREFWLWLASWAIFLQRPSDLGFSDEGYDLPPIEIVYHEVKIDLADGGEDRDGQFKLMRDSAIGLAEAAREKRDSLGARVAEMKAILDAAPEDHFLLWHDLEAERHAIEVAVPGVVSVYGSQDLDEREQAIIDFSDGKFRLLAAKPVIAGSGCNFQRHCHKAIFVGVGFKFNDFIQAVHRIQRFQQRHPVEIHIIHAESEREVLRTLQSKWKQHEEMVTTMTAIIREHGLATLGMTEVLTRTIGLERIEAAGEGWSVANNDCVEEMSRMDSDSLDLVVTSIPFGNHYEYSASYNDFGHTDDDEHFFGQMDYLTPQMLRCLKPGRLACIHVKDRVMFGNVTGVGFPTINPFHAKCIAHYCAHGFAYMGLIFIDTDVVRENNGTYRLGYTEMLKDGTKMGVGSPEFVLLFRKRQSDRGKGYADDPVGKRAEEYSLARWQIDASARWRSSGNRLLSPAELAALSPDILGKLFRDQSAVHLYDFEAHVKIGEELLGRHALPTTFGAILPGSSRADVWDDVNRLNTLNKDQANKALEKHVCPLQFDIVDRLIERYSQPGELVFDPFGGLFTVPYRALQLGRRGRASELNPTYFLDGIKYLQAMERSIGMPSLFDLLAIEDQGAPA